MLSRLSPSSNSTFGRSCKGLDVLNIADCISHRHNCDTVTIRWLSKGPGQEPEQVTGIIVLETVNLSNTWLIKTVYSEFNSGAWLVNLGIFKPSNCSA